MNIKRCFQNLSLVLLGLFLGVAMVEGLMRGAGFIYSYLQERENLASLSKKGKTTILCIGESTTVVANYPRRLERILDKWAGEEVFSVVNKGIVGTSTQVLVDQIADNIERYHPDIVIAMMGINDSWYPWWKDVKIINSEQKWKSFCASLKIYKLLEAIVEHVRTPRKRTDVRDAEEEQTVDGSEDIWVAKSEGLIPVSMEGALYCKKRELFVIGASICEQLLAKDPGNPVIRNMLAYFYRESGRLEDSEKIYLALLNEAPFPPLDKYSLTLDYAMMLSGAKRLPEASEKFKAVVMLNPEDTSRYREIVDFFFYNDLIGEFKDLFKRIPLSANALVELAEAIVWQKQYKEGIELCRRALELDPGNRRARLRLAFFLNMAGGSEEVPELCRDAPNGEVLDAAFYAELGQYYYLKGDKPKARRYSQQATAADPEVMHFYIRLQSYYKTRGYHQQAENIFPRVLIALPNDVHAYLSLIDILFVMGERTKAYEVVKEAFDLLPRNDVHKLVCVFLEKMDRFDKNQQPFFRDGLLKKGQFGRMTVAHYNKLQSILRDKGIPLVAVQYPMLPLALLKSMLFDHEGVIFVDNNKIFQEAVDRDGYEAYFADFFADDFGHFTARGAEIFAENIAKTMIKAGLFEKLLPAKSSF